jgi:hypothetical protein
MTSPTLPFTLVAGMLLGPVIWAAHFLLVYALESLLCRAGAGHWHGIVIAAVTALAFAWLAVHGRKQLQRLRMRGVSGFHARAALTLDALSLVAIMLVAAVGLALPSCR